MGSAERWTITPKQLGLEWDTQNPFDNGNGLKVLIGSRIVAAIMTDKEIALELGTRLIKCQLRIAAMSGELCGHRDEKTLQEIPWRDHVEWTLSEALGPNFQLQIEQLSHALDAAKPEDLLRTLCNSLDLLSGLK